MSGTRAGVAERDIHTDTTTIEGRAMFGMLSVLAELQRDQAALAQQL